MDYSVIARSIPPSTLYAVSAILFGISVGSALLLIIRIVWQKLSKNEVLKYEFITIVAHKFRTPLTHIKWATGELANSEQDPYRKRTLADIQESNDKLIKLTNTLIEITDNESGAMSSYVLERTSLTSIVKRMAEMNKDEFHAKNVFFVVKCPPEEIFVQVDRQRIEFVLETLLENALHYTPPGKNVTMTLSRSGRKAFVTVADEGIGIAKEDLPFIFNKFFRTQNAQETDTEGFGVGLYLAQSVMERHKGSIDVDSPGPGLGSVFTVTFRVSK